jgi:integrase/recombinase XerD
MLGRLAAIRSLCRYAASTPTEHAATIGRVLEIPAKRRTRATVGYLALDETEDVLAADQAIGRESEDHGVVSMHRGDERSPAWPDRRRESDGLHAVAWW